MKFLTNFIENLKTKYLTHSVRTPEIFESREITPPENRDTRLPTPEAVGNGGQVKPEKLVMESFHCPYCGSTEFVKRGFRQKKREKIQLYLCSSCNKTFTPYSTKGKHYPLSIMLDTISIYNLGYSLEKSCQLVKERSGIMIPPSSLTDWLSETTDLCRFSRMREFALKKFSPKEMIIHATLAHRQLYRYRFHRAKCSLMIKEEYQHRKFTPLQEFLEMVPVECPHQYFQRPAAEVATGIYEASDNGTRDQKIKTISGAVFRASESPLTFSKIQMIVRAKQNYANKLCAFALQGVKERKQRHEALQKFMLCNDSVTVATEVPVYITRDDIEHMKTQLGFEIYIKDQKSKIKNTDQNSKIESNENLIIENSLKINELPKLITGHIDILQIRNGQIHILDYKPRAEKERPIEQLTLYAMALSRLTGLRLFEFKCAWFDEKDYFEFYPLHVLHKPKKNSRRRKITTNEGVYKINQDRKKILSVRPIQI